MVRRIRFAPALLALVVASRAGAAGLAFVERTGAANPLDGADVGGFSTAALAEASPLDGLSAGTFATPHFGDLDGDDCPELVSGTGAGSFRVFAPEPAPVLGGAAALGALRAARRRRRGFSAHPVS